MPFCQLWQELVNNSKCLRVETEILTLESTHHRHTINDLVDKYKYCINIVIVQTIRPL